MHYEKRVLSALGGTAIAAALVLSMSFCGRAVAQPKCDICQGNVCTVCPPTGNPDTDWGYINTTILAAKQWESQNTPNEVYVQLQSGIYVLGDHSATSCNGQPPNPQEDPNPHGLFCFKYGMDGTVNSGLSNMTIEGPTPGNGTTELELLIPESGFFDIEESSNITIANLTLNYQNPPFIQGLVQDVNLTATCQPGQQQPCGPYIDVSISTDSQFQDFSAPLYQCSETTPPPSHCPTDPTPQPACPVNSPFLVVMNPASGSNPARVEPNAPNFMRVVYNPNSDPGGGIYSYATKVGNNWRLYYLNTTANPDWQIQQDPNPYIAKGDHFVFVSRNNDDAIRVHLSDTVVVKNIIVHGSGGLVADIGDNTDPITVNNLEINVPTESDRLISSNADGAHFENDRGPITVVNSSFEGMADDAVVIYSRAFNVETGTTVTTGSGGSFTACLPRRLFDGDQLQFVDPNTGVVRGTSTITGIGEAVPGQDPGCISNDPNNPNRTAEEPYRYPCTITMQDLPNGTSPGDLVYLYNGAGGTTGTQIYTNTFNAHRGHGILLDSPGSTVRNNTFTDLNQGGIMIGPWYWHYSQGPVPNTDTISVHNNTLNGGDVMGAQSLTDENGNQEWCNWDSTTTCDPVPTGSYDPQILVSAGVSGKTPATDGPTNVQINNNTFTNPAAPSIEVGVGASVTMAGNQVSSGSDVIRVPGPSVFLYSSNSGEGDTLSVSPFTLTSPGPDTDAAVEINCDKVSPPSPPYESWNITSLPIQPVLLDDPNACQ